MTSRVADKYMKKMFLRWKKMEVQEKDTYTQAVAVRVSTHPSSDDVSENSNKKDNAISLNSTGAVSL